MSSKVLGSSSSSSPLILNAHAVGLLPVLCVAQDRVGELGGFSVAARSVVGLHWRQRLCARACPAAANGREARVEQWDLFSQPNRSAYAASRWGQGQSRGGRSLTRPAHRTARGRSRWIDRSRARGTAAGARGSSSIDSTSSNGGGGRSSMQLPPFDYTPRLRAQRATPAETPRRRPHLALESQDALKELTGVMEEGVKMFDVPPATAGPRASTSGGELSSEENAALVSRLKDQIRSTDALVKKLYARNSSLEQQVEEMESQAEQREQEDAKAGGSNEVAQLRLLAAEKERFIEELQAQLVVTVQEKEAEAAAQADRAAAELRAVQQ